MIFPRKSLVLPLFFMLDGCAGTPEPALPGLPVSADHFEIRVGDGSGETPPPGPDDLICERKAAIGTRLKKNHCVTRREYEARQERGQRWIGRIKDVSAARRMGN